MKTFNDYVIIEDIKDYDLIFSSSEPQDQPQQSTINHPQLTPNQIVTGNIANPPINMLIGSVFCDASTSKIDVQTGTSWVEATTTTAAGYNAPEWVMSDSWYVNTKRRYCGKIIKIIIGSQICKDIIAIQKLEGV